MAITIAITRNTPGRIDGFLASCMLNVAPGVYVAPRMKKGVRDRVWKVLMKWDSMIPDDGGVTLFWENQEAPSGISLRLLGWPKKELVEYEGHWLTFGELTGSHDIEELLGLRREDDDEADDGGFDPNLI